MSQERQVARDISYAGAARSLGGRAMIRLMENATGRLRLIRRASGYGDEIAQGRDFWQVMVDRYGLTLDVVAGSLDTIPRHGPLIVIANHPFGILDGLMLGHVLRLVRGDFRILAHRIFRKSEALDHIVLPVSFDGTKTAARQNLDTRKTALDYLAGGGAIGVFPGGTVATAPRPFGQPMDPVWRNFTAKMIARSGASVVPIYFDGHNSRLFQLASHLHVSLRMGLLLHEFGRKVDAPVRIAVGQPVSQAEIARHRDDAKSMMDFLRERTYALSPRPLGSAGYGFEFEDRYRAEARGRRHFR